MPEAEGQEPTDGGQEPQNTEQQGDSLSPEQMRAELARARSDAAKYRTERNQLQTKVADFEQSHLSELEKTQRRVADLEAAEAAWLLERQTMILSTSVAAEAVKANAVRPDAIFRLVDPSDVVFDENGHPTNLDKVVAKVRDAYPELFHAKNGSIDGGPRGGTQKPLDMNDWLRGKVNLSK